MPRGAKISSSSKSRSRLPVSRSMIFRGQQSTHALIAEIRAGFVEERCADRRLNEGAQRCVGSTQFHVLRQHVRHSGGVLQQLAHRDLIPVPAAKFGDVLVYLVVEGNLSPFDEKHDCRRRDRFRRRGRREKSSRPRPAALLLLGVAARTPSTSRSGRCGRRRDSRR